MLVVIQVGREGKGRFRGAIKFRSCLKTFNGNLMMIAGIIPLADREWTKQKPAMMIWRASAPNGLRPIENSDGKGSKRAWPYTTWRLAISLVWPAMQLCFAILDHGDGIVSAACHFR
jgi:hypothetical protein